MEKQSFNAPATGGAFTDTGEGSMSVVAYWPSGTVDGEQLSVDDVITRNHPVDEVEQVFPGYMALYGQPSEYPKWDLHSRSLPLSAVVHLGTIDEALWNKEVSEYWRASRNDLTETGVQALEAIEETLGRPAIIITHLST